MPRALLTGIWILTLTACVLNPATGERQFALIDEAGEIALGREGDAEVRSAFGQVKDPALESYVQEVGKRLAARSERPDLPWTFGVLDDPVVNAFALPGGFIYVTRGILAHLDSEAQLAAVLGHEIGHVTGRHSVEQMSRAQLAGLGIGLGTALLPPLERVAEVMGAGVQLVFLKYGREDETQADDLGLRYVLRTGYDPRPMTGVYEMLARAASAEGGGSVPEWLSTHPDPANRRAFIAQRIAAAGASAQGGRVERDAYLARLEGLIYGENPREGFFRDGFFAHPALGFSVEFPAKWQTTNRRDLVAASAPDQAALLLLQIVPTVHRLEAVRKFLAQPRLTSSAPQETRVNGLPAAFGSFRAQTQEGEVAGMVAFIAFGEKLYRMLGYSAATRWDTYKAAVQRSLGSFAQLDDHEALAVQPLRLQIVTLPGDMTLERFAQRYPSSVPLEELARLNQVSPDAILRAGTRAKRVVQPNF